MEDQIHQLKEELQQRKAAQVGILNAPRVPDYQIRRPKSLLLQSCAYILFNYSSWIISGF